MKEKNKKALIICSISLLIVLFASATYAYLMARMYSQGNADIEIEAASVDTLTFSKNGDLNLHITKENLAKDGNDVTATLTLTANLKANNYNNEAHYSYNLYLDILKNEFIYTQDENTPELVLKITDPTGNTFTSKIEPDLNVDYSNRYDITEKSGMFTIIEDYGIDVDNTTSNNVSQNWKFEITFLNLDTNQYENADKAFSADIVIQSKKRNIFNISAIGDNWDGLAYRSNEYKDLIKNIYIVNHIDENLDSKVDNWDLSTLEDKSIMGWLEDRNDEDREVPYDLYIGSEEPIKIINFSNVFSNMQKVEKIDLGDNLDTLFMNDTSYMFYYDKSLTEIIGIENLNVSNVTNMSHMFAGDYSNPPALSDLDLSKWNVSKVKDMSGMFEYNKNMKTLIGLNNWNVSNVTNMRSMFNSLKINTLDISNWNVSNVTNMSSMFNSLKINTLDISNWNTSKVEDMSYMFNCIEIENLDINNWNTSNVTNMNWIFGNTNLTKLDLSGWETTNLEETRCMFLYSSNLLEIKMNKATFGQVTEFGNMFEYHNSELQITINQAGHDWLIEHKSDIKLDIPETNFTIVTE